MELNFAPNDRAKSFKCSTCPSETQALRRCREPREDFTHKDHAGVFPILITKDGEQFSFCPGKATWDSSVVAVYNSLVISAETGCMWNEGGLSEQPQWFMDLLSLFIVRYNDHKFWSRARAILGESPGIQRTQDKTPLRKGAR